MKKVGEQFVGDSFIILDFKISSKIYELHQVVLGALDVVISDGAKSQEILTSNWSLKKLAGV